MRKTAILFLLFITALFINAVNTNWPELTNENRPGVRWWWLGSAVDKSNLTWNLEQLSKAGIGAVEITPIYGVKGNDSKEIDYLSKDWMSMLDHTQKEAKRLNIQVDMSNGTGWPFGGPHISNEDAATKLIVEKIQVKKSTTTQDIKIEVRDAKQKEAAKLQAILFAGSDGSREVLNTEDVKDNSLKFLSSKEGTIFALFAGKTFQQVKRAAPGGQGLVMDHFNKKSLEKYLNRFDEAFSKNEVSMPVNFFNDSYEVYGGDWTNDFIEEFKNRRGYDISKYIPELMGEGDTKIQSRVICDYRLTISELLLNNFTLPWSKWANSRGSKTRNQAHGSPGNLLDLYGAIDIPECESFGISRFDIPGFRIDSVHKESDSNPATLKYASSAAHVTGKKYTSAESMTWLTEHFRTSLSQIKPEMDQLFLNGVNRIYFHGSPYTPKDAAWPGWLFYASILVNSNNTIFRDMPSLNEYAARVQSFLQEGKPDNEILLYFPIYDIWQTWNKGHYVAFDIHKISEKLPAFEKLVFKIRDLGYDLDYVSDDQLVNAKFEKNAIVTQGGNRYKMILVADSKYMPEATANQLLKLKEQGAEVAFLNRLPDDVPGLSDFENRKSDLKKTVSKLGTAKKELTEILDQSPCTREEITALYDAGFIRRRLDDGFVYFFAMQKNKSIDKWVKLGKDAVSAIMYNPVSGKKGKAAIRNLNGRTEVYVQLMPGESLILRTFDKEIINESEYPAYILNENSKKSKDLLVRGKWEVTFTEGMPEIPGKYIMNGDPASWTSLNIKNADIYAGTAKYKISYKMPKVKADEWMLNIEGLCESAVVKINGVNAGTVWSLPYTINVGKLLKPGKTNLIEIDVTNLPANLIADYDRRGVEWRIFKEINFVDVAYKTTKYDKWPVMPSGIIKPVRLTPLFVNNNLK